MKLCAALTSGLAARKQIRPQDLLRLAGLHQQLTLAKQQRFASGGTRSLVVADLEKQIEQCSRILPMAASHQLSGA